MHGTDGILVFHSAHNRQLLIEWLQRFDNCRQFEILTLGCRRPLVHDRAEREVDESHVRLWVGRGLRQGGPRWNHRIQQRQSHGDTGASKKSAAGKMSLRDEHWLWSPVNCSLSPELFSSETVR